LRSLELGKVRAGLRGDDPESGSRGGINSGAVNPRGLGRTAQKKRRGD